MADDTPDKIIFGIGQGRTRGMVKLADGTYALRLLHRDQVGAMLSTSNPSQGN